MKVKVKELIKLIEAKTAKKVLLENKVVTFSRPNKNLVILIGGTGTGKSTVLQKLVLINGYKIFSTDRIIELIGKKFNVDLTNAKKTEMLKNETKPVANAEMMTFLNQLTKTSQSNIVLDCTGSKVKKIDFLVDFLKPLGYSSTVIYVTVDEETALARNRQRARQVPDEVVTQIQKDIKKNLTHFYNLADNIWWVYNSIPLTQFREGNHIRQIKKDGHFL